MQYALLIARDETGEGMAPAAEQELTALFEKLGPRLKTSARLHPTTTATSVRVRDGGLVIADGPFAETRSRSSASSSSTARTWTRRSTWPPSCPSPGWARSR